MAINKDIENPATFAMEEHLEVALVQNWSQTALGKEYDIYEDEARGAIIAMEDDQRLRSSLAMVPTVEFFRYEISFNLVKTEQKCETRA